MLPRKWMEAYLHFLLRSRWLVIAISLVITVFFVNQLAHTRLQMNFMDFYPPGHPNMQLVKKHSRMFGSANILVVAVEATDGDTFTVETLNKIDWTNIDMNINSLPIAAIGIGIDYGYYVLSRITEEYARFAAIDPAIEEALMTTGRAILFTGTTLTASVIFWLFFPMKFQVLIVGDHLLPKITPHVGAYPNGPENPLGDFLDSQRKVREMDVKLVLPAHGAVFTDHRARANQIIQHHECRLEEVSHAIRRQPKTAYDIAVEVFGHDESRPLFHILAATFETLAHLHFLLYEELVKRIEEEDCVRFVAS